MCPLMKILLLLGEGKKEELINSVSEWMNEWMNEWTCECIQNCKWVTQNNGSLRRILSGRTVTLRQ